jgi:hypothetical protein
MREFSIKIGASFAGVVPMAAGNAGRNATKLPQTVF